MPWAIALIATLGTWWWHSATKQRALPFELWLYDQRVKSALAHEKPNKSVALVQLDDDSLVRLKAQHRLTWPLPRFIYGLLVDELSARGARIIAFDFGFATPGTAEQDRMMQQLRGIAAAQGSSDEVFADAMKRHGGTVFGVKALKDHEPEKPLTLLAGAALAVGHMRGYSDAQDAAQADDVARHVDPYVVRGDGTRVWQLALVAVAPRLKLDLDHARDEPATWLHSRRLVVPKRDGGDLVVPLTDAGQIMIHWSIPLEGERRLQPPSASFAALVGPALIQRPVTEAAASSPFKDRVVFVGATTHTQGPGADRDHTPYRQSVASVGVHMNLAASFLDGRLIWTLPAGVTLSLLACMAFGISFLTWRLRVEWASFGVLLATAVYFAFTYLAYRWWQLHLPVVTPIVGAVGASYLTVLGFRLIVERSRVGRVNSLFGQVVAPDVVELLMEQRALSWDTSQKNLTVLFADIRGFTAFTDQQEIEAAREIEELQLEGPAAIECKNRYAAASLESVSLYLSTIVDAVKHHRGTLDKYIGDCVMAFYGAPVPDAQHAARAVRSAIEAQRRVHALNIERQRQNELIAQENRQRLARGEPRACLLPTLTLGISIHTGGMIVGFMGSKQHLSNYTVFGRNVNLAARIEKEARSGHIVVTQQTYEAVKSVDPKLAESMVRREEPVVARGILDQITLWDVRA